MLKLYKEDWPRPEDRSKFDKARQRFWGRVNTGGDCWLWTGHLDIAGYGVIHVGWRNYGAHRVSYFYAYGPIPDGLWVLHLCDCPACVNPLHLYLGTAKDNARDVRERGRKPPLHAGSFMSKRRRAILAEVKRRLGIEQQGIDNQEGD